MKKTKNTKPQVFLIPYKKDGSVAWEYPSKGVNTYCENYKYNPTTKQYDFETKEFEWKENKPFKAGLKFVTITRGASSVRFVVENTETKARYQFRGIDFTQFMKKTTWIFGVCLGEWKFRKQGKYISIIPAND